MKYFFILFSFISFTGHAQKLKKADKAVVASLQAHVGYLASDALEGRRAGSEGEKKAAAYITDQFVKAGIQSKGTDGFLQAFEINDGRFVHPSSHFILNGSDLVLNKDYFPLTYCPDKSLEATSALALQEPGAPWFFDLKETLEKNKHNPHFDLDETIRTRAADVAKKGCAALILYNTSSIKDGLKFEGKAKKEMAVIPVVYLTKEAALLHCKDETAVLDIKLKVQVEEKKRYGHNVIGYLDNGAATTVVIGAHYDHLGYGEDQGSSLYAGTDKAIHNGADDNASGTAALIELVKLLRASRLKNNNYLFIAFSAEELGLFGSKYFVEHPTIDLGTVDYMINMDMVGRLNDSSHALTIGGYGTSPAWGETFAGADKYFTLKLDSSGTGPSDHTSFYKKNIPVLFFFTGLHTDYHKPGDDAEKINYTGELMVLKYIFKAIEANDKKGRLVFTKTREMQMNSTTRFKVTLGIMPDYSFSGSGVRVDDVIEGKAAQKAGIKAGDVLYQLGDFKFSDMQTYMETLGKFAKGDATKVKLKRGTEEINLDVLF